MRYEDERLMRFAGFGVLSVASVLAGLRASGDGGAVPVSRVRRWGGMMPEGCEVCGLSFRVALGMDKGATFVDGALVVGRWGVMCDVCHREHGIGVGVGRGQRYRIADGVLVEGGR